MILKKKLIVSTKKTFQKIENNIIVARYFVHYYNVFLHFNTTRFLNIHAKKSPAEKQDFKELDNRSITILTNSTSQIIYSNWLNKVHFD